MALASADPEAHTSFGTRTSGNLLLGLVPLIALTHYSLLQLTRMDSRGNTASKSTFKRYSSAASNSSNAGR